MMSVNVQVLPKFAKFVRNFAQRVNTPSFDIIHKTPGKLDIKAAVPPPIYGGRRIVTIVPGSGVGPELVQHIKDVYAVAQAPIDFELIEGETESVVQDAVVSIQRNAMAIKGNLESRTMFEPLNVHLRNQLDLFVYCVNYKSYPNVSKKHPNVDIVLVRQNTEGEYAMLEHETIPGVVESMKIVTRSNTERLARWTFEYALKNNRKRVTIVHKNPIMRLADGLFLDTIKTVAEEYPQIQTEDIFVDRLCRKLVTQPHIFDVLLMSNLYGNIAGNLICGLLGGPGMFSGKNYGEFFAVFEPATRYTGHSLQGKNIANPVAMLRASVDLLYHVDKRGHAKLIEDAIYSTIVDNQIRTPDIGGTHSTRDIVEHIKNFITQNIVFYREQF